MRVLDDKSDKKLDAVTLFLTKEEALQLRRDLDHLLANPKINHTHLSSEDYQKEITVCVYDENDLQGFFKRTDFSHFIWTRILEACQDHIFIPSRR